MILLQILRNLWSPALVHLHLISSNFPGFEGNMVQSQRPGSLNCLNVVKTIFFEGGLKQK